MKPFRPRKDLSSDLLLEMKKLHDSGVSYRALEMRYRHLGISWQTIRRRILAFNEKEK